LSFEQYGDQTELQYSRCGLTNDLYNCNNTFVIFIRDYSCFCTEAGGQVDKTSCVYNTSISVLRSVSRVTGISPELQMDTICRWWWSVCTMWRYNKTKSIGHRADSEL